MGLDNGENQGNEHSRKQIGEERVGGQCGGTASKFGGDDCRRSGCGTDEANQRAFAQCLQMAVGRQCRHYNRNQHPKAQLDKQQPPMPPYGHQLVRLDLAKREQQLRKDENRHDVRDCLADARPDGIENGKTGKQKISRHTSQHGEREGPVLKEFEHHIKIWLQRYGFVEDFV